MKTCRNCNTDILNKENVFCSKSCAAKYNNRFRSKETIDKQRNTLKHTLQSKKILNPKPEKVKQKDIRDPNLIPLSKYAVRKYTGIFLNKDSNMITYEDVEKFKEYLNHEIWINRTPLHEIQKSIGLEHSGFDMFLRKCLKLKMPTIKIRNDWLKEEFDKTRSEREIYYSKCEFKFDPYKYSNIPGFDQLVKRKMWNTTNLNGVVRDHMISKIYGWNNKIDPSIISHPANCEYMSNSDNCVKSGDISITLEHLFYRIEMWDNNPDLIKLNTYSLGSKKGSPKSEETKRKLSLAGSSLVNYTNGFHNVRQHKDLPPPEGNYKRGMTRINKMVASVGLEPTIQ